MLGLFKGRRYERAGFALYQAAVAAAREPWFYESDGVPDTLDGRFDMVGLHVALLVRRLHLAPVPGPAVAQAVFDAMFTDMDHTLREMGLSDMTVGKKVKAMWEAFHGRAKAYEASLGTGDPIALTDAIQRNLWRSGPSDGDATRIAQVAMRQAAHLEAQDLASLAAGKVDFLASRPVAA